MHLLLFSSSSNSLLKNKLKFIINNKINRYAINFKTAVVAVFRLLFIQQNSSAFFPHTFLMHLACKFPNFLLTLLHGGMSTSCIFQGVTQGRLYRWVTSPFSQGSTFRRAPLLDENSALTLLTFITILFLELYFICEV